MSRVLNCMKFPGDSVPEKIRAAMDEARREEGTVVVLEPGTYEIRTDKTTEMQSRCMSGAFSSLPDRHLFENPVLPARIIDFKGHRGTRFAAEGAKLQVDGFAEAVSVRDCSEVAVEGLEIDTVRRPFSVGKAFACAVLGNGTAQIDVLLDEDNRVARKTPVNSASLYYDTERSLVSRLPMYDVRCSVVSPGHLRFTGKNLKKKIDGCTVYVSHIRNFAPAVRVERALDVRISRVAVRSQPGCGILCINSENVALEKVSVVPAQGMHFSCNSDCVRITGCRGRMSVRDCEFRSQGGNAVKINGYYHNVLIVDGNRATVRMEGPFGNVYGTPDYPRPGDIVELTLYPDLSVIGTRTVKGRSVVPGNNISDLELDTPLPVDSLDREIMLFNASAVPELEISGCQFTGGAEAGILCRSRGVRINGNVFEDMPGTPVHLNADVYKREGPVCSDIIVEENVFRRCGYGSDSESSGVLADITADEKAQMPQIRNIKIRNNVFDSPESGPAVMICQTDGLEISGNSFKARLSVLSVSGCSNTEIIQ